MEKHVLISGAGIAGLTLAHQLKAHGFTPTVVERWPTLRTGGYKIDIRGVALEVVRRMGIYKALAEKRTDFDDVGVYDYSGSRFMAKNQELVGFSLAYMGIDPAGWTNRFLRYLIEKNPVGLVPILKEFGVKQIHEAANAFEL